MVSKFLVRGLVSGGEETSEEADQEGEGEEETALEGGEFHRPIMMMISSAP